MSHRSNKKFIACSIVVIAIVSVVIVSLSTSIYALLRTPSATAGTEQPRLGTVNTQQKPMPRQQPTPPALAGDTTSFRHARLPAQMSDGKYPASVVGKREYVLKSKDYITPTRSTVTSLIGTRCPNCGTKKSGKASCCGRGGTWFGRCGDLNNFKFEHTWVEGIRACASKFQIYP